MGTNLLRVTDCCRRRAQVFQAADYVRISTKAVYWCIRSTFCKGVEVIVLNEVDHVTSPAREDK